MLCDFVILIKPEIRVGKWQLFHCTRKRTYVVGKHNSLKHLQNTPAKFVAYGPK
jgi:hypothetical protein